MFPCSMEEGLTSSMEEGLKSCLLRRCLPIDERSPICSVNRVRNQSASVSSLGAVGGPLPAVRAFVANDRSHKLLDQ